MSSHQNSLAHRESVMDLVVTNMRRDRADMGRTSRQRPNVSAHISSAPGEIWGQYNNYRANGVVVSAIVHVALLGLLLSGAFFSHQIVQRVESRPTVTLIAPPPDSYALPTSIQTASGGGGGGDRDPLPAPNGHPPKAALQQIAPPAIVVRNENPRLAVQPTAVIPPQVHLAENHMPTIGPPDLRWRLLLPQTGSGQAVASVLGREVAWVSATEQASAREAVVVSAAELTE